MSAATYVGQRGASVVLDTPHEKTNGYWVGTGGDIVITQLGTDITYQGVQNGTFLPFSGTCIKSAGTTALQIKAIY